MIKFLKNLNTNWSLFNSLSKKLKAFFIFLKQRKLLTVFLILVIFFLSNLAYQKLRIKSPKELYELEVVTEKDIKQTVSASGSIQSQTKIDLKFQTAGQLAWVGVKEGDYVNQWQALASLDQKTLKKTIEKYLLDYSKERNDFEEDTQTTYSDTVMTDTIKRILQKNQWDLNKAVLDIELHDITLKYATLVTPIKGIVTHIDNPVPGINITPATAVFTIADPEFLEFVAKVDEVDIGSLKISQPAEIILDAYPNQPINSWISSIDFDASTDSSGSTVYMVKFKLNNPDLTHYRLGMNGEVVITTAQKQGVITVPYQSLLENGQTTLQVLKENKIKNQVVTTGLIGEEDIEIISGLEKGQVIVVSKKQVK